MLAIINGNIVKYLSTRHQLCYKPMNIETTNLQTNTMTKTVTKNKTMVLQDIIMTMYKTKTRPNNLNIKKSNQSVNKKLQKSNKI